MVECLIWVQVVASSSLASLININKTIYYEDNRTIDNHCSCGHGKYLATDLGDGCTCLYNIH